MGSRVLHLRIKDNTLVACLDYIEDKTSVTDAVKRTLEAFTLAMVSSGKLPRHSQKEIDQILISSKVVVPEVEISLESVAQFIPKNEEEENITRIAREVEEMIESAATPHVQETVEIREASETEGRPKISINLFQQYRETFDSLRRLAPKDRFIEQVQVLLIKATDGVITEKDKLFVAALEIVYTNLSKDLWGTEEALHKIQQLIAMHQED